MIKTFPFLVFLCILVSCAIPEEFPFDAYDYSRNNVTLGLSFVPDSSPDERGFSAGHFRSLNIGQVRMGQSWHLREPINGTFNWQPLRERLDFYESNNIQVLLTLDTKQFPDWTSNMDSSQIQVQFAEYLTALLTNFASQIAYIQLGNEWNWEIDTYLNGDVALFIALNNILYDTVQTLPLGDRPEVVLGSISIGGLRSLAFTQGRIENIWFDGLPLYTQSEIDAGTLQVLSNAARISNVFSNCEFSKLDLHFYDEYWNWPLYKTACLEVLSNAGKTSTNYHSIMVSEFGGPEPRMEGSDPALKAERLVSYIHTLDNMGVVNAYYFKLVEGGGPQPHSTP